MIFYDYTKIHGRIRSAPSNYHPSWLVVRSLEHLRLVLNCCSLVTTSPFLRIVERRNRLEGHDQAIPQWG